MATVQSAIGSAVEFGISTTVKAAMTNVSTGATGAQFNCYLIKFQNKKAFATIDVETSGYPDSASNKFQITITGATVLRTITLEAWQNSNTGASISYGDSIADFWITGLTTSEKCKSRFLILVQLP